MKKRPSMTAVLGRTCPHCFSMIDPVWYGWHIGQCPSSNKLASTLKQDTAPRTPVKNEVANDTQLVQALMYVPSRGEAFVSLPAVSTPTLTSDSQIAKERVSVRLPSIESNVTQHPDAVNQELHHLRGENQALTDKVKGLELKLEDLQFQLKLSKEAETKALCLVESLRDSLREKNGQVDEECLCSQPMETSMVELKAVGLVDHLSKDKLLSHKHVDDCPDHLKEKGAADKKFDLDRVVDLACGEGAVSQDFFSHVDGFIKAKEIPPSIVSTSRKQRILLGALINGSNEDDNQDSSGKSGNVDSTKLGVEILSNLQNGSSATDVLHEDNNFTSHASEPFVFVVDKEVPTVSTAPRDVIRTPCLGENFNNMGCSNSLQADGCEGAKMNGNSAGRMGDCSPEAVATGPALEMQFHAVDTDCNAEKRRRVAFPQVFCEKESDLNAKQILEAQSRSSSSNAGPDVSAVKRFRRMVLQSDSDSDSGKIQDIAGICKSHHCNIKGPALPAMSSEAVGERSEESNAGSRAKNRCTSDDIEKKASQPPSQRSKRLKVVCSSDESDYATCKGESEQSSHKSAQDPEIAATDLGRATVDGITDGEHTGARRSKRLRKMSIQNTRNSFRIMPSSKTSTLVEELISSSCAETIEGGSEIFKSEASASSQSMARETHVKRTGPLRMRKRLFEEIESRPEFDNKDSTDSEADDSKIESDADSLDGFITESEGRENSGSSSEGDLSICSYSSLEFYINQRRKRDLKMKNYVWELEGEMLSVLEVDPKLCLRAVCALNRRQTEDEQKERASKYSNKRGFDMLHAARGSHLAEFLTDGDASGPVKKSVEDLEKFDAGAVEFCKMIAFKHSKQLFEMYTKAEDPHFPFS